MEKKIKKKCISLLGLDVIEQNACDSVCNAPYASPASTLNRFPCSRQPKNTA